MPPVIAGRGLAYPEEAFSIAGKRRQSHRNLPAEATPTGSGAPTIPDNLALRAAPGGTLLPVRVIPRAARTGLDGVAAGALRVRLTAPPVDGAANAALIAYLAGLLAVPKSAISVASGVTARQKTLLVEGLAPAEVRARLALS
jgi:uncharacterized protein YggU (UPF0235/DUF167 family)